ncbi:MAG: hypothetical protein WBA10_20010 [Elainellaceae cyanobacterium]
MSRTVSQTVSQRISGVIAPGHGVASGRAVDSPYPQGTIDMQRPVFAQLGLNLSGFFSGTLNIFIHPYGYRIFHPEWTFRHVTWTDHHPPEDFSFSRCQIWAANSAYDGLIYYPHPETKRRNFQAASTLEVIAPYIAALHPGDRVHIDYNPSEIEIYYEGETEEGDTGFTNLPVETTMSNEGR